MKSIYYIITLLSLFFVSCSEELIDGNARGTVTGSVRLESSNEPLENVNISTTSTSLLVFSNAEVNFESLNNLPLGYFSVRAELKGYVTAYQSITICEFDQKMHIVFEMVTD